ncbi:hypothetical protein WAZ07_09475 [Bacillus sp. FJAT-51639]|uniref:Signal peptidase II n=1 Tax=Bacillus bruguierae TaxID=3127667 RepID=A0ABU8FFT8_9BACI
MNKWGAARFRLIFVCITIIAACTLSQGALYSREKMKEAMKSNSIDIVEGFTDWVDGEGKPYKTSSVGDEADDPSRHGRWFEDEVYQGAKGTLIPNLQPGKTSDIQNIITYICITIIILITIWRIYRSRKNQKQLPQDTIDEKKPLSKSGPLSSAKIKNDLLPHHPIRAELVKWERQLPGAKQRRSYETIQQWFTRIGCSYEIVGLYEKIRYGDFAFTSDEQQFIRDWVKKHT